jgi:hypothetical protein
MKYFSILGERCSGTTFVEYALLRNFKLQHRKFQGKHFFGNNDDGLLNMDPEVDDTLFVYVVRNPIDWIDSFFKRLHHVPPENKRNLYSFINNEFYSIHEEGDLINTEMLKDRNIYTGERYKDIFELRKIKNDYIMNTFSRKVKNLLILKYEDLRDNYENTLDIIKNKYLLETWNPIYVKIEKYKGTYTALYYKKPILLQDEVIVQIINKVDREQENILGYNFIN